MLSLCLSIQICLELDQVYIIMTVIFVNSLVIASIVVIEVIKIKNTVDRMSMNFVGSLLLKQQQVALFLKRSAKSPNMTLSKFQ